MNRRPEKGRFGSAVVSSYTYFLTLAAYGILQWYTGADIAPDGPNHLPGAIGIQETTLIWVFMLVGGYIVSIAPVGTASLLYTKYTGQTYVGDRIGFAKSGGNDIAHWCGFLSFVGILYVFARFVPEGALGPFRPFVMILLGLFIGIRLTSFLTNRLYTALYRPTAGRDPFSVRGFRCQVVYPTNWGRCAYLTHQHLPVCRWHRIMIEFRKDWESAPWLARGFMYGAGLDIAIGLFSLWRFSDSPDIVWLFIAVFGFGSAFTYFADSMIAVDYPLSQYAFWGRLLATGLVLSSLGALATAAYVVLTPEVARSIIAQMTTDARLIEWGPAGVGIVAALIGGSNLRLFIRRILFVDNRYLNWGVWGVQMTLVVTALQPLLNQVSPVSIQNSPDFWQPIFGTDDPGLPVFIIWMVAFNICEMINVRMRRRELTQEEFKRTFEVSFGACMAPGVVGIFVSRYLLTWVGISGVIPFALATIVIALILIQITTRWVINWGRQSPLQTTMR